MFANLTRGFRARLAKLDPHDIVLLTGAAAVVVGVDQIYRPAAWIIGGLLIIGFSIWSAA